MRAPRPPRPAGRADTPARAPRPRRLACEQLEDRTLLSITPLGDEFRVNTATTGDQSGGILAHDGAGNFLVVYRGTQLLGIYGTAIASNSVTLLRSA